MEGGELRRDRLADDDRARRARQRHGRRICCGPMVGVDRRTVTGRHVEGVEQVLDRDRQPVQQSCRRLRVEHARTLHRSIGVDEGPGANRGLALGNALETVAQQRYRGDLSRGKLARRRENLPGIG